MPFFIPLSLRNRNFEFHSSPASFILFYFLFFLLFFHSLSFLIWCAKCSIPSFHRPVHHPNPNRSLLHILSFFFFSFFSFFFDCFIIPYFFLFFHPSSFIYHIHLFPLSFAPPSLRSPLSLSASPALAVVLLRPPVRVRRPAGR